MLLATVVNRPNGEMRNRGRWWWAIGFIEPCKPVKKF